MVNCFLARGGWLPEQLKMNGGWGVNINITSGPFVSSDAVSDQKINKLKLSRASLLFHGCKM